MLKGCKQYAIKDFLNTKKMREVKGKENTSGNRRTLWSYGSDETERELEMRCRNKLCVYVNI